MRIAYITAGAAGMFCGSCIRDNTLTAALRQLGHDALLIPTYTPIRTDELDVSQGQIFFGGINVYLQEKSWLFRHTPRWLDWLLNRPSLLRWASKKAVSVDYADLAEMTVSMLQGREGRQRKELAKLLDWLQAEIRPEVVVLTNALLSGMAPAIQEALKVPVFVTLQGDDIFLEALPQEPRQRCLEQIRRNDQAVAGYLSTSRYYADFMARYFQIERGKIDVVPLGLNLTGHGGERPINAVPTLGYFARIGPEKGFHNAVEAFLHLRSTSDRQVRFKASGWLGPQHQGYFQQQLDKLRAAGLEDDFQLVECPDLPSKVNFLKSVDVLTVPTEYLEPKGLSVLEAMANGTPVVQPRHGAFPELLQHGGGVLVEPGNIPELARVLGELLHDPEWRRQLGDQARRVVREHFTAQNMALRTAQILQRHLAATPTVNA